ncbi:DUF7210 family protein [Vagococcus sp. WN89Y]|uniref:DUF7210 family protein n=1 Tax=Vagococcus sp. WN89Y TaxID=3457258 RepID=UPI003FCD07FC
MAKQDNERLNADGENGEIESVQEPEYVVLRGNTIRHNGAKFASGETIPVAGDDARRLLKMGIIADIQVLRAKALGIQDAE